MQQSPPSRADFTRPVMHVWPNLLPEIVQPAYTTDTWWTVQNVTLQPVVFNLASLVADLGSSSPGTGSRPSQQALGSLNTLHACCNDFSQSQQLISRQAELHRNFSGVANILNTILKTLMLLQFQNCSTYVKRWASMPWQARTLHKIPKRRNTVQTHGW